MARIKIELPTRLLSGINIPVRITDVNYGNHVGNDAFISIIHEARMQWLAQHGFSEMNFGNVSLIMSDLAIEFKLESFYGDIIKVNLFAGEIGRVSFDLFYELTTLRNDKSLLLCIAKTGMVCYDYNKKKTVSVPSTALAVLQLDILQG